MIREVDINELRTMRQQGHTLKQIAEHYGVSLSYVHTRLSSRPKGSEEKKYAREIVIPYLRSQGHVIVSHDTKLEGLTRRPDIISVKEQEIYFTEVKMESKHSILTALGQLVRFGFEAPYAIRQLVMFETAETAETEDTDVEFLAYAKKIVGFEIIRL
jgi:hypothetical protein